MTTTPTAPIALQTDEGEALSFLGILATIKASAESTNGRIAVIEHLAPRGSGSPPSTASRCSALPDPGVKGTP